MEVRLTEFSRILGVKVDLVRSAIHHNTLPFLDANRKNAETQSKLTRRTYSVSDAFLWFLQERMQDGLGLGAWKAARLVQSSLGRGMDYYLKERLAGNTTDDFFLVLQAGLPNVSRHLDDKIQGVRSGPPTISYVEQISSFDFRLSDRTFLTFIRLDLVFDLFKQVVESNGWSFDQDGFSEPQDTLSIRKRMTSRHRDAGLKE
jgi:hypothetical protein